MTKRLSSAPLQRTRSWSSFMTNLGIRYRILQSIGRLKPVRGLLVPIDLPPTRKASRLPNGPRAPLPAPRLSRAEQDRPSLN